MTEQDELTLDETAERLGVHYMTVYRYVRTGRLPATKAGTEWRVRASDIDGFRTGTPTGRAPGRPVRRRIDPTRLEDRLLAGDEAGAWTITQQALASGAEPDEIYLDLLAPGLVSIGVRWSTGEISIADEHRASVVATRLVGRLGPLFLRRARTRGTVIVGVVRHDRHGLPTALFADLLRRRGFGLVDLGADTPPASFRDAAAGADRLIAVGICATTIGNDASIAATIRAVKRVSDVPVVLGGSALADASVAARLGADHWRATTVEALALFARLGEDAAGRRRARPASR